MSPYPATVVRVATVAFALTLLAAAPASSRPEQAPTYYYRVLGGSMVIETRDAIGIERLDWSVAPHPRGTRPAPGFPTADGSGGLRSFQLRFPARGTYAYDADQEDSGQCQEAFALAPASRGTAAARQQGSRIRISWGLDPRRKAGYVPHPCRPPTNNALLYFAANQPSLVATVPTSAAGKKTFTLGARGTRSGSGTTVSWQLTLGVQRLGRR